MRSWSLISTKNYLFVLNTASLNANWQTVYVYARSIHYAINFPTAVREKASRASIELLNFFKQFFRPPTVICLIERTEGILINFQAVVEKRVSEFELLKCCCRIFQQRSQTDFVSNQRAQVLQRVFFPV